MTVLAAVVLLLPFVLSPGASFALTLTGATAGDRTAGLRVGIGTSIGIALIAAVAGLSGVGNLVAANELIRAWFETIGGLGRVAKCCCGAGGRSLRCVARCHYGRGLGCDPGRVPVGEDAGSPAGGSAHGGRGDRVAVPDGISVAGSARAVRELEHDLQELPALGDRRGLGRPVRPRAEASVASG